MESHQVDSSSPPTGAAPDNLHSDPQHGIPTQDKPSLLSASTISSWARNLRNLQPLGQADPQAGNAVMSSLARFTSGLGSRLSSKAPVQNESVDNPTTSKSGVVEPRTKGIMDSPLSIVKAVQVRARHVVSQNKRRYQEDGFDLDMTYITDNIIAMGFPAGDMSSGILGYVEGFYRNHMEEVVRFFETRHKNKYKVYNLCSERLYDTSLFQGKVASFPFDDHNCPPIHVILFFCQSASSWLKENDDNVVAIHCKAGIGRTGMMISSLLLYLKLFLTAEESVDYYNQKRCIDGRGITVPSQIRYVKYFERILTCFNGEVPPGRRCMIKGFRLLKCPYWIRPSITISDHAGILFSTKRHPKTKDLLPEDFWFSSKKKGITVFALPGEPGLTEVVGDFKIHFHDRQGDFYCWLNTTMTQNRLTLSISELDDFDKRKIPAPGFQVEIVMVDSDRARAKMPASINDVHNEKPVNSIDTQSARNHEKDDVFSDSESEGAESSKTTNAQIASRDDKEHEDEALKGEIVSIEPKYEDNANLGATDVSEFKPVAADASVFSFGDEEDYASD